MQLWNEKKPLPGRMKLVFAVVVAMATGLVLALMKLNTETSKVEEFTGAGDTFVLVHLDEAKSFSEANAFCEEEYGTTLAIIEDSVANQRFWDALAIYSTSAWLGFADMANADDFDWVDANPTAYVNWDAGEPTDLCVQMLAATGTWKDVDCAETTKAFFCEASDELSLATAVVRVDGAEVHSLAAAVSSAEAHTYCQSQGAELYSLNDDADNARIQKALNALALEFAFFGLETVAVSYKWLDGRSLDFDQWADGQPLESHFSLMRGSDGKWLTACASDTVSAVVCTAGIVQTTAVTTTTTPPPPTTTPWPPLVFEEPNVDWEPLVACNEDNGVVDYYVDNRNSPDLDLSKVVSVLFVPSFAGADFDAFAVQTHRCNYAVQNLNKHLEMSYQLRGDGSFKAQADTSKWYGRDSALRALKNSCEGNSAVFSIDEKLYQGCDNHIGIHFATAAPTSSDWCRFVFNDTDTYDGEIYVAFDNSGDTCPTPPYSYLAIEEVFPAAGDDWSVYNYDDFVQLAQENGGRLATQQEIIDNNIIGVSAASDQWVPVSNQRDWVQIKDATRLHLSHVNDANEYPVWGDARTTEIFRGNSFVIAHTVIVEEVLPEAAEDWHSFTYDDFVGLAQSHGGRLATQQEIIEANIIGASDFNAEQWVPVSSRRDWVNIKGTDLHGSHVDLYNYPHWGDESTYTVHHGNSFVIARTP